MSQKNEQEQTLWLHHHIASRIRQDLEQQALAPHTKIPSEVELAKRYNVSRGTITKALDTLVQQGILYRRRPRGTFIAAATEEKGLLPETPAAASDSSPVPTIGLLVPYMRDSFFSDIVLGVEMITRAAGYGLSFAYSENDRALEHYHVEQFLRQGVAGMIIFPCDHPIEVNEGRFVSAGDQERVEMLQQLQRRQIPFVLLDRYVPEIDCDYVVSDDLTAGYAVTQHLISLGHRRIGFVTRTPPITSSARRYEGYLNCLKQHQIPLEDSLVLDTLIGPRPPHHLQKVMRPPTVDPQDCIMVYDYLKRERPGAVVAMSEYTAFCILQASEQLGLRIPEDLAVVCSGDCEVHTRVPMTSIVQPVADLGRQGASILLDLIAHRSSGTRHMMLPVSLIVRKSCGARQQEVPIIISSPDQ